MKRIRAQIVTTVPKTNTEQIINMKKIIIQLVALTINHKEGMTFIVRMVMLILI